MPGREEKGRGVVELTPNYPLLTRGLAARVQLWRQRSDKILGWKGVREQYIVLLLFR